MLPSCAARWRPPLAHPTRPVSGTGRPPTRHARSRRSCSCANTERRCSAKPRLRPRVFQSSPRSSTYCRRTRAAPRNRRLSSNSRRRSRSDWPHSLQPPSHRPTACWSRPPAPAFSRSSPRQPVARSSSTSWLTPAPICSPFSFRRFPSRGSTRRRSTIILIAQRSRPSC